MRKVVDSNFLQKIELRNFLSKSAQNSVVLTDYAAMEAYCLTSAPLGQIEVFS
jgi:hypothetical protein